MVHVAGVGAAEGIGGQGLFDGEGFVRRPGMSADGGGEAVEGVELFNGAVAGKGDGDAGVEEGFEGVGPGGAFRADAVGGPGVAGDELRLAGDDDLKLGEALEAIGWDEGGMFDAVAVVAVVFALQGVFDGVERFAQRLVADGMDGDLEAFVLGVAAFLFEVLGVVDADAEFVGLVGVGFAEEGGLCAQRAVGEKFGCAEAQAVVAEGGADAVGVEVGDGGVGGHADDAEWKLVFAVEAGVADHLIGGVEEGLDGGDAGL